MMQAHITNDGSGAIQCTGFDWIKGIDHIIRIISVVILLFFVIVVGTVQANSLSGQQLKGSLTIRTADKQEFDGSHFRASGNVEIAWGQYRLYADFLDYDNKTREMVANGRVTLVSDQTVLTGGKFKFNLKTREGVLYDTFGQLSPSTRFTTGSISQVNKETMKFKKLDFTSCAQCIPRWKITCKNGKIIKEKYIEMKHALFKIKNVPVLYIPYMRYPINKSGRATGFLMPNFGHSTQGGAFISNAFFWNIKPNFDLTLNLDNYKKAGKGYAQQLRYLFPNAFGEVKFYFFDYIKSFNPGALVQLGGTGTTQTGSAQGLMELVETLPDTFKKRNYDYFLKVQHNQSFNLSGIRNRLIVNIDRQSDPNFLQLFGDSFETMSNRNYSSSVSLSSSYNNIKVSASTSSGETYNLTNDLTVKQHYLPKLTANLNHQKLGILPGYLSLALSYNEIEKEIDYHSNPDKTFPDISSTRINVSPTYSLNLLKEPWFTANLKLKSSHNFYNRSWDTEAEEYTVLDTPISYNYQSAEFSTKGPIFSRIFTFKNVKLKHIIEPKLTFRYAISNADEVGDRIIVLDNIDRTSNAYSHISASLTTRLLYKSTLSPKSSARDILSYTIKQDYYFDPALANSNRTVNEIYPEFSHLSNTIRFKPINNISLDASLYYHHYLKQFNYLMLSLNYTNKKSPLTGNFKYIKQIDPYRYNVEFLDQENQVVTELIAGGIYSTSTTGLTETIGFGLNLDVPRFPFKMNGRVDYDLFSRKFMYSSFVLGFDYQCVVFKAGWKLHKVYGKLQSRFDFGISFGNLGMVRNLIGL